ncbi:MAG TPA: DUF3175 domain-containing protein [Gammaproteobacteria bacterium]
MAKRKAKAGGGAPRAKRGGRGRGQVGRRGAAARAGSRWSAEVTRRSDALDLEPGVFTWDDPKRIAASLKRSAEASERRKAPPFQSAMSMLNLYVNRAGRNLPEERRQVLERAKDELRKLFGREPAGRSGGTAARRRGAGRASTGR